MPDKLPCLRCATPILLSTAQKNGGLCMPCKQGRRDQLELARKQREEARTQPADPVEQYWHALIERVYSTPDGFERLVPDEQRYYAACLFVGEVYNGGLPQFFSNSAGSHYASARQGLLAIGARRSLDCLDEAAHLLFPDGEPSIDVGKRRQQLAQTEHNSACETRLNELQRILSPMLEALRLCLLEQAIARNLLQVPTNYLDSYRTFLGAIPHAL